MSTAEQLAALAAPFSPTAISWRVGSMNKDKTKAMALAYVDARDVQDRLDEVMGIDWQCEFVPMPNSTACCRIGLMLDGVWRWRSNGAGATDIEGDKGQYSDAFKRAAVLWGVGRYLYALPSPWVAIDQYKRIVDTEMPKLLAILQRHGGTASSNASPAPRAADPAASDDLPLNPSQARKQGEYPRIEAALRACETVTELAAVWTRAQPQIVQMPHGWQEHITAEKDRCKAALVKAAQPELQAAE